MYVFPTGAMQAAGGSYDWLEGVLRGKGGGRLHASWTPWPARCAGARGCCSCPTSLGSAARLEPPGRGAFVGSVCQAVPKWPARCWKELAFIWHIWNAFRSHGGTITALRRSRRARSRCGADPGRVFVLPFVCAPNDRGGHLTGGGHRAGWAWAADGLRRCRRVGGGARARLPRHEAARYAEIYGLFCDTYATLVPIYDRIAACASAG